MAVLASPGLLAGTSTGMTLTADDLLSAPLATPVVPGSPLINPSFPPTAGTFSVGGGAHYDVTGGAASSGFSCGVPSGSVPLDVMGADFDVFGDPGDTITFIPSGILDIVGSPGTAGTFPLLAVHITIRTLRKVADLFQDLNVYRFGYGNHYPEPSSLALVCLGMVFARMVFAPLRRKR